MRSSDILQMVYGDEATGFHSRLADIADTLVQDAQAREDRRMAEAELRDEMAGYGPLIDQVAHALTAAQNSELTDSRLPAVLTFDAYCVVKDASKADPSDRGLKTAAHLLYDRWNQDPMGHITVGELFQYRERFTDQFPKSAVKQVFDEEIPQVGFNTLTNLPYLTRIASEVVDQDSYERAMEFYGLDGDRADQIRARGYVKSIAELALSDENFQMQRPDIQQATQRIVDRVAQELESQGPEEGEGEGENDISEDSTYAPEESELPHDEMSEEMATIDSPITGEPLVVELGLQEDEGAEGMEPPEHGEEEGQPMHGPLPGGAFEAHAQFEPGMGAAPSGEEMLPGEDDGDSEPAMQETMTTVVDPSSGQELQMTLKPIEDEAPMGEPEGEHPLMEQFDELGGGEPLEQEGEGHYMQADAPSGWEPTVRKMKKHKEIDNPFALANWMKDKGYKPHKGKEKSEKSEKKGERGTTAERGTSEAMNTHVPTQQGPMTGDHSETDAQKFFDSSGEKSEKSEGEKSEGEKKATKLSREQVQAACASMGLTTTSIEDSLLNGDAIAAGQYLIRIGSDSDEVELRRLVAEGTEEGSRLIRSASMAEFDGLVSDFMALTAAQFASGEADGGSRKTVMAATAAKDSTSAFVVTADVPQQAIINARRMMASVWGVAPDAEGEIMDDGRLAMLIPSAEQRDIARIAKVLTDIFGVENIESMRVEKVEKSAAPSSSPYHGQTPVARQPAGAPGQPMRAPMQQPLTGSGAQQDFIARHTDPLKHAEGLKACGMCGEMHDESEHRMAQMDEEMPPEGDDGLDDIPLEEGGEGGEMPGGAMGGAPPPMPPMGMMPGMGMPGGPMGGPMGGEMGGMMEPDASQVPIDIQMGVMQPEDQAAVQAAMTHFRNMGMGLDEALDKFLNAYSGLFDKYGDKNSVQRNLAVAAAIQALAQAFAQPAVVPAKKSGEARQADLPHPKPPAQHPGKVTVKKDWAMGNVPQVTVPTQPGPMQGEHPSTDLGDTNSTKHNFGGDKKPGGPQKGSRTRNQGTEYPSTNVFEGTDGVGGGSIGGKMDSLSRKAPSTLRSAHLVVAFDPELGDFHLLRGEKKLAIHASMNDALADAERRVVGTEARILIADGMGGYEDAVTGENVSGEAIGL